jgi:drug/metabolite transporter (DMT)-like permease
MPRSRVALFALLALSGFSANSLLCRFALRSGAIDAGTFTAVRLAAGAAVLVLIVGPRAASASGSWISSSALAAYAIAFSYAYLALGAGIGAFVLFAAVQATMIGGGIVRGERLGPRGWIGLAVALGGLGWLTIPGSDAPPAVPAAAMALAGIAWGIYSLRGRGSTSALAVTAGNFARAVPIAAVLFVVTRAMDGVHASGTGLALAIASGAFASGLAYACWYAAVPHLGAVRAGVVQLAVPAVTAAIAVGLLGEAWSARLLVGGAAIVAGIAIVLAKRG